MNCQEFQEHIGAYLEGILEENEKSFCQQHLATCAECRALAESSARLHERLLPRGPLTSGFSLSGPVMERIRRQESEEQRQEPEEESFLNRLLNWRWSFGMGTMATAAVLILFALLGTPNVQMAAAEIMTRGAEAVAKLRNIHLRGMLRTNPADNFSAIAPEEKFVAIELWKEFEPVLKWRVEKPGRVAVMNGSETMLFIRPDFASKFPSPSNSAFDTQWLHEIANLSQLLNDEIKTFRKNGWKTSVSREQGKDGRMRSVVAIEAKAGFADDDYLKNKFFSTADTRRVYVFDEASGLPSSARIYLHEAAGDILLFDLDLIEGNTTIASDVFQLRLPENVAWAEEMKILSDNEKYVALSSEQAARAFFEACSREDWNEVGKFGTVSGTLKTHLGGIQIISTGDHFTSAISLINGAEFVPYEIKLKNGEVKKHNLALKRDPKTKRWYVDGGI
jgi:hypothetical protein